MRVIPYMQQEDGSWTIPDHIMEGVWLRIMEEGNVRRTWPSGAIITKDQFMGLMKSPSNAKILIWNETEPLLLSWINGVQNGTVWTHFCGFRAGYGNAKEIMEKAMDHWFSQTVDGEFFIQVAIGVIPAANKLAIKAIERAGSTVLGEIPDLIYNAYKDRREGAAICYIKRS